MACVFQLKVWLTISSLTIYMICSAFVYTTDASLGLVIEGLRIVFQEDLFFEVTHPEEIKYTYRIAHASDFGTGFNKTLYNIPLVPVDPLNCCSPPLNAKKLSGNVALIFRGECSFLSKAIVAEEAGAVAVIIMDSDIENDSALIQMQDDETQREVHIPAVFLLGKDGYMILKTLRKLKIDRAIINIPVNITNIPWHKQNQPPWDLW